MKKATIFALALMAGAVLAGSPLKVEAASAHSVSISKIVVTNHNTLKECLDKLNCEQLGNSTIITIPCMPGGGQTKPELPETPDTEVPETPDTNVPETPGTEVPETPDTNVPETPGTDNSEKDYHAYVLRVLELVNEERAKEGLNPLTLQENITAAAQVRAIESEISFSHTRPNGSNFSTALKEAGVSYRSAGENIAWGQRTPEQVMNGWMNSPGHRANILNEKYTAIGIGYYQNAAGVNYWSQLFIMQ